jgi:hypothetical protein
MLGVGAPSAIQAPQRSVRVTRCCNRMVGAEIEMRDFVLSYSILNAKKSRDKFCGLYRLIAVLRI